MDPLSATASVLTLVGASGAIATGLKSLYDLRNDKILHALQDEITDVQLVVRETNELLERARDLNRQPSTSLLRALENVRGALLELERFFADKITIPSGNGVRIDKSTYLRAVNKLERLKDRICRERQNLDSALNRLTKYFYRFED